MRRVSEPALNQTAQAFSAPFLFDADGVPFAPLGKGKSQWDIPMLFGWVFVPLGLQHLQGVN
jgi:hypothetical protein